MSFNVNSGIAGFVAWAGGITIIKLEAARINMRTNVKVLLISATMNR